MDDIMFVRKSRRPLDVAVQLRCSSYAALDLAINGAQEYPLHPTDARDYFSAGAYWATVGANMHIMSLCVQTQNQSGFY